MRRCPRSTLSTHRRTRRRAACAPAFAARPRARSMAGGLTRTYHVYLPAGDPQTPMPLVFVHHGFTMSGQQMFDITELRGARRRREDRARVPRRSGRPADDRRTVERRHRRLLEHRPARHRTLPATTSRCSTRSPPTSPRISASIASTCSSPGFSMGGYFSHHAGCMRPRHPRRSRRTPVAPTISRRARRRRSR